MTKATRDILDKLDRIELFITDSRFDYKPGTFEWMARLEAALDVRRRKREVKDGNSSRGEK